MRGIAVAPVVLALLLGTAVPATAAEAPPVSLVVGLRPGADTGALVEAIEDDVDVLDSAPVEGVGAVTLDVPAGDVDEAAAALRADPAVAYVEVDHRATASAVDPYRSSQWGLTAGGVTTAWSSTRGSSDVVVAVLDTGVTVVSDLAGKVLPGYDFVNSDRNAADDQGHGTQVATTLAGRADNGIAGAGVCPNCRILPVKVLDATGSGAYSAIAAGMTWAVDHGADILNLSLGGPADQTVLRKAVAYAVSKGVLVVAAAGNDGSTRQQYPGAISSVLAVGAATSTGSRYAWSNHGSWVDIAAPGCNVAQARGGAVGWFCGTSSATPFVAGVAGLLRALTPRPTAGQIRGYLTSTATDVSWVSSGRVNAAAALTAVPLRVSGIAPGAVLRGTVAATVRAGTPLGVVDAVRVTAGGTQVGLDTAAPFSVAVHTGQLTGPVALTFTAYRGGVAVGSFSVPVTVDNAAPTVRLVSTLASAAYVTGTARVGVVAADAQGVARVELLVNGTLVGRYAGAAHTFDVDTKPFGRTLAVQARAYDRAGNVRYAATRTWRS